MSAVARQLATCVLVVAVALAIGACGEDASVEGAASAATPEVQQIVVTRKGGDFRKTCDPRALGRRLRAVSGAVSTAEAVALRRIWGKGFWWFRIFGRHRAVFEAENRPQGIRDLKKQGGVRLRFDEAVINSHGGVEPAGTVWSKSGVRKRIAGKAQFSCRKPNLVALSTFTTRDERLLHRCPRPDPGTPSNALVVCARPH